nr:BPSL0067 family protein [uncultured Duganella sp.]
MPFVYQEVDALDIIPAMPAVGDGSCVALIKHYVPGLKGVPTSAWRAGGNVLTLGDKVKRGTAIATFVDGRYPNAAHGNHAAIVLKVMKSGFYVIDQWKDKGIIQSRFIRIPPPQLQYNRDGSFRHPSDNALAFYVIER